MTTQQWSKLVVVVPLEGMDNIALATVCVNVAEQAGIRADGLKNYGRPVSAGRLKRQLEARKTFLLEGDGLQAHLACITDFRFGYLTVTGLVRTPRTRCCTTSPGARWRACRRGATTFHRRSTR